MQNFHRYFLRLSYLVWAVLAYDALKSFWFEMVLGLAWGTIVLTVNVVLIAGYVFGCHRVQAHGGRDLDRISEHPARHKLYGLRELSEMGATKSGPGRAWSRRFADIYVRLCSMGSGMTGESCKWRNTDLPL